MINRVRLASNEYANPDGTWRHVDQIEVHVMDMWLRKDITCARDAYLAQRLADEADIEMEDYRDGRMDASDRRGDGNDAPGHGGEV